MSRQVPAPGGRRAGVCEDDGPADPSRNWPAGNIGAESPANDAAGRPWVDVKSLAAVSNDVALVRGERPAEAVPAPSKAVRAAQPFVVAAVAPALASVYALHPGTEVHYVEHPGNEQEQIQLEIRNLMTLSLSGGASPQRRASVMSGWWRSNLPAGAPPQLRPSQAELGRARHGCSRNLGVRSSCRSFLLWSGLLSLAWSAQPPGTGIRGPYAYALRPYHRAPTEMPPIVRTSP